MVIGEAGDPGAYVTMEERRLEGGHVTIQLHSLEEDFVLVHLEIQQVVHVMEDGDAVTLQASVMLVKEIVTLILTVKVDSSVEVTTVNHLPGTSILMGLIVAINHHHQVNIKY